MLYQCRVTSWQLLNQIELPQETYLLTLAMAAAKLLDLMTLPTWQLRSSQCRSLPPVQRWAWRCWGGVSEGAVKYVTTPSCCCPTMGFSPRKPTFPARFRLRLQESTVHSVTLSAAAPGTGRSSHAEGKKGSSFKENSIMQRRWQVYTGGTFCGKKNSFHD